MKLEGHTQIQAPRRAVWTFVTDPERLATCLPGAPTIERLDASRFRARATVKVGFLRAPVVAEVELAELREPDSATLHAHGRGPGSTIDVTGVIRLTDGPGGSTSIGWSAVVETGGLLAGIGSAQVEETAARMVAETLGCVQARLEV